MAYKPEPPTPPAPTESVKLFGVHDGARRLGFLAGYFGMCMLTIKSCLGCPFSQLLMLHAWWFVCGCFVARALNEYLSGLANETQQRSFVEAQRAHARAVIEAMAKQPLLRIERNPATDALEDVRAPLRERPLIDKEMGVRVRH